MKDVEILAAIEGGNATVNIDMIYANPSPSPIECIYEFPLEPDTILSELTVKHGDKVVQALVTEKERAQEVYDDAMGSGNIGITAER